ncbi:helix-turn-helix domain-containing protein [Kitasatospora sp. NPDC056651]|uniref:helix-turn-helix domain-containing protein n=1 Tax=Kitasatospora sp. NPDC056651 TaxID=3345892 RepID=UPI00367CDB2A
MTQRRMVGWSQEQLAEHSTVSVRTIRNLETGAIKNPRRSSVELLVGALFSGSAHQDDSPSSRAAPADAPTGLLPVRPEPGAPTRVAGVPDDARWQGLRPKTDITVGRRADLLHIVTALRPGRPLVLTGPAGVGKTRLALDAAAHLLDRFRDGVAVLELGSVTPEAVDPAAASAQTQHALDTLFQGLDRDARTGPEPRMLLVVDNAEHVIDTVAGQVRTLLERHPALHILITSLRAPAGVPADLWEVSPLPVDRPEGPYGCPPAAELFCRRVHSVVPTLDLRDQMPQVVELCRRLGGLALAIENAAVRMRSVPLHVLVEESRVLPILGQEEVGGLSHHRSLHRSLAWAYGLLDERQRRALGRLSRLPEEFSIDDVRREPVDEAWEPIDDGGREPSRNLDLLAELVGFSVVQVERGHQYAYRVPRMMREYVNTIPA